MTAVYPLRRLIKLSFACTSWRKSRESLKEFLNRKEKIMTADLARLEQCWAISREELKPICHEGKTQPRH